MSKKLKWEIKQQQQPATYGKVKRTDYDIPSFSYKSALLLFSLFIVVLWILPYTLVYLHIDPAWPTVIIGGVVCGFTIAYIQFFKEKKEKLSTKFWIIGSLWTLLMSVMIFLLYFYGILL